MMRFKTRLESMTPEQLREESERVARYAGELLQHKPSRVEVFARAYCKELGYDPDGPVHGAMGSRPRWMTYRDVAEAALHEEAKAAGFAALQAMAT